MEIPKLNPRSSSSKSQLYEKKQHFILFVMYNVFQRQISNTQSIYILFPTQYRKIRLNECYISKYHCNFLIKISQNLKLFFHNCSCCLKWLYRKFFIYIKNRLKCKLFSIYNMKLFILIFNFYNNFIILEIL